MNRVPNYWDLAVASAKRAIELEAVSNISYARLKQIGPKDFLIQYGFFLEPSDDDLEALSLIETEMVSDIWNWVGEFRYEWKIASPHCLDKNGEMIEIVYKSEK